jgi:hypothetical protein
MPQDVSEPTPLGHSGARNFPEVKILKHNSVYRVVDVIFRSGNRWRDDRNTICTDQAYEHSILRAYLEQMTVDGDFATLRRIVHEHTALHQIDRPDPSTLVVHLRLGDIMGHRGDSPRGRAMAEACYRGLADLVAAGGIDVTNATIVTALHFGANESNRRHFHSDEAEQNSFEILALVVDQLSRLGLDVSIRSSTDVDQDLCFMAGSTFFVKGLSLLSDVVAECLSNTATVLTFDSSEKQTGKRKMLDALRVETPMIGGTVSGVGELRD